jgi:hypothetical protein
VEEEVKGCVVAGASMAKIEGNEPVVRHFVNYNKLANQIAEAKNGRIILVSHDMTEHPALNTFQALRLLGRKVRRLKDSVESALPSVRGQLIPISIVVTNFEFLKNDLYLDEEIAGLKWRLLPGKLHDGRFAPEPDNYRRVVCDIADVLRGPELAA